MPIIEEWVLAANPYVGYRSSTLFLVLHNHAICLRNTRLIGQWLPKTCALELVSDKLKLIYQKTDWFSSIFRCVISRSVIPLTQNGPHQQTW